MDFLKTFVCDVAGGGGGGGGHTHFLKEETPGEENDELSLGLSSNGRFGVERRRVVVNNNDGNNNRLARASSVVDFWTFPPATEVPTSLTVYPPLTRTSSLPIETEEWKKRKELQSLRRSEAKRERVGKMLSPEDNCETKRRNLMNGNELWRSSPASPLPPLPRLSHFPSQVSIGSPASGGSSGVSDLENQPFSGGTKKDAELKSTGSQHSVWHDQMLSLYRSKSENLPSDQMLSLYRSKSENLPSDQMLSPYRSDSEKILSDPTVNGSIKQKTMLADMPRVSTKGNGKKIQGFLYGYRKGEQVRIVCLCHGSFLSPAEFVKHGGGGDVEHPLRHIVMNPPSPATAN